MNKKKKEKVSIFKQIGRFFSRFRKNKDVSLHEVNKDMLNRMNYKLRLSPYKKNSTDIFVKNPNLYIYDSDGYSYRNNSELFYQIYENDSQFRTLLDHRGSRLKSLDIKLVPCKSKDNSYSKLKAKRINDYINRQLINIAGFNPDSYYLEGFSYFINYCLTADIVGKAIIETIYKTKPNGSIDLDTGYYEVKELKLKDQKYFTYLNDTYEMVLKEDNSNDPVFISKYQFIDHVNKRGDLNPHGRSDIGSAGYYLYKATQYIFHDYINSSKRHGDPPIDIVVRDIKNEDGTVVVPNEDDMSKGMELAEQIVNGDSLVHDERFSLAYLKDEIGKFGFKDALEFLDLAKTKLILESTTTIQNSENTGSMALGNIHQHSLVQLIMDKAKMVQSTLNRWILNLLELNGFNLEGISPPILKIEYEEESVDSVKLNYIVRLNEIGLPIKLIDFYSSCNLELPDNINKDLTLKGYPILNNRNEIEYIKGLEDINKELYSNSISEVNTSLLEQNEDVKDDENDESFQQK